MTAVWSSETARFRLAAAVRGDGLELGPGHVPFPTSPGSRVRYVDRWEPSENRRLFPELGEDVEFPKPDLILDLDRESLAPIRDQSQDFIIASHVFEHVSNPLRLLEEALRVLRPRGLLLLLLPDRHSTFDRERQPTPLSHVVDDHSRGVTSVDDSHLVDFLKNASPYFPPPPWPPTGHDWRELPLRERVAELVWTPWSEMGDVATRQELFRIWRMRSIHVHVWDEEEFGEVLAYANEHLGHHWQVVDASPSCDDGRGGIEFGYLLRRP